jgi:putative ABC transport system permease protein
MYVLKESFVQAYSQLIANKLRSFLSLLGIMIGIFCIIAVKSAVDSLEDNVRSSFDKLGNDVIYVTKMPWNENPDDNYYKYARRPNPGYKEYKALSENMRLAKMVTYSMFVGMKTIKYQNNSVERCFAIAITEEYERFHKLEFAQGRYFSQNEYQSGLNRIVIGHKICKELFGDVDPIGREVKMFGKDVVVVGVLKKSGKSLINFYDFDNAVMIGFEYARSVVNVKPNNPWSGNVQVKAADGVSEKMLKDDVTINVRKSHYLKPREKDDFSMNSMTMFADEINGFFAALNMAGLIIGIFALLVGIFSVANIMFVSVKERTSIIGIKKALGAKKWVILLEFLIESVLLCLIGGVMGLVLVWLTLKGLTAISDFEMYVSPRNMVITLLLAIVAGIVSGFIPAWQAAKMDPVEAIRS